MEIVKTSSKILLRKGNNIELAKDDYDNLITINGIDFYLRNLNDDFTGNKGGNSNIFKLLLVDTYDDEEAIEQIIKISKIATPANMKFSSSYDYNRFWRFKREIDALKKAQKKELDSVIQLYESGEIVIQGCYFLFYTMEKANSDLSEYLNTKRSIQQKILLFQSIIEGIKQLHDIEIYHRDIKHDNIFVFGTDQCKIGDLGLIRYRKEDNLALDNFQRIGAFGWETPEAMNKFLTEKSDHLDYSFDCDIDESSDIFQLGKLFWFILQGNLPIGYITEDDFQIGDNELFEFLKRLLQHGKGNDRRPLKVTVVEQLLAPIAHKYATS